MTSLPTFRDPAGSLALEPDRAVRTIQPAARESTLRLLAAPFYQRAQQRGDIIASTLEDTPAGLRLLHPRIPLPTHPWEWTPSQWLAAAELTLTLCAEAIAEGWILKDATPLNILFLGPRPILVDVLSFEPRDPASNLWLAYAQYTRTFLLPLLMNRLLHWPLTLSLFHRDGLEPAGLYRSLSPAQRLSPLVFGSITLPALLESRKSTAASAQQAASTRTADPELTAHILQTTIAKLRKSTRRALPKFAASEWADYPATLTHYTPEQSQQKRAWVQQVLQEFRPTRVLDIGANTGEYSTLAAQSGAQVFALERDAAAAERLFRSTQASGLDIQTIHADFSRPTPAAGWQNAEQSALLPRLQHTRPGLILMLAVLHHILLLEQIPLPAILALLHTLAARHLLIEWVPATDPMFQSLVRGREALYSHLSADDLLAATAGRFTVLRQLTLGNGRTLFLFEKVEGLA